MSTFSFRRCLWTSSVLKALEELCQCAVSPVRWICRALVRCPPDLLRSHGPRHLPSRARRRRLLRRTRRRPGQSPAQHCRPRGWPAADPQRGAHRLRRLQRRILRLSRSKRPMLDARGHQFRTHCDTELFPHLWEDHGDGMLSSICTANSPSPCGTTASNSWCWPAIASASVRFLDPANHAGGDCLLFASEIKALLASGMDQGPARSARHRPGLHLLRRARARTCFEGVNSLLPGHYLTIQPGGPTATHQAKVQDQAYWEIDFPDQGQEDLAAHRIAKQDRRRLRRGDAPGRGTPAAGRRAGCLLPQRRHRFEHRRRPGGEVAGPSVPAPPSPVAHTLDNRPPSSSAASAFRRRLPSGGTSKHILQLASTAHPSARLHRPSPSRAPPHPPPQRLTVSPQIAAAAPGPTPPHPHAPPPPPPWLSSRRICSISTRFTLFSVASANNLLPATSFPLPAFQLLSRQIFPVFNQRLIEQLFLFPPLAGSVSVLEIFS